MPKEKENARIQVDWAVVGYYLFEAGSILYFAQSMLAFSSSVNSDLTSLWLGVIAGAIFVVESTMYMYGWFLGRSLMANNSPFYKDWNFWGNTLFVIGSVGYQITSIFALLNSFFSATLELNFALAILFVVDSLCYLFAVFDGKHSRAPSQTKKICSFSSPLDFYFQATIFFIFGSVVYVAAAVQDIFAVDSSQMYLLGAIIFLIDAPCYILSGYQLRDEAKEVPILQRRNMFFIQSSIFSQVNQIPNNSQTVNEQG